MGAPPAASGGGYPPPAPPRRRGGVGRILLIIGIVVVVLGLVWGAIAAVSLAVRRSVTRDLVTQSAGAAVRVANECGSISLVQGDAGVVKTRATVKYTLREPTVSSEVDDGVVSVRADCQSFGLLSSVSLVVKVPPGGSVEARSSAGSVQADGLSSQLVLRSSAGSISATELNSRVVSAETSAGSVSLSWARAADPATISATSSAGSVKVLIPDVAGVAYRVDADSSAGSTKVNVRSDPQSRRTITATSSAGSVLVDYR
ncbi:MAG: DUF4097 family beta strand repeat-containing protein [Candidatus Nanopelagicales bacterium]